MRWDDGVSIHVDESGRPIAVRPDREDYADNIEGYMEYLRAVLAFHDKVSDYHAKVFHDAFMKEMRGSERTRKGRKKR